MISTYKNYLNRDQNKISIVEMIIPYMYISCSKEAKEKNCMIPIQAADSIVVDSLNDCLLYSVRGFRTFLNS